MRLLIMMLLLCPLLATAAPGWTLANFEALRGRCEPYGAGQRCEAIAPPDGVFRGTFDAEGRWVSMTTFYAHAMTPVEQARFQGEPVGCVLQGVLTLCTFRRPGQHVELLLGPDQYLIKITRDGA